MPITSSAKKALRASKRKRVFNLKSKSNIKAAVKQVRDLNLAGKKKDAEARLSLAFKALDKAVKRRVITKNAAARRKSRLALSLRK